MSWIERRFGPESIPGPGTVQTETVAESLEDFRSRVDSDLSRIHRRNRRQNRAGFTTGTALAIVGGVALWGGLEIGSDVISTSELAAPQKLVVTAPPNRTPITFAPTTVVPRIVPSTTVPTTTTTVPPKADPHRVSIESIGLDMEWDWETGPGFYDPSSLRIGAHAGYEAPGEGPWSVLGVPHLRFSEIQVGDEVKIGDRRWTVYQVGTIDRLGQEILHAQTGEYTETVVLWDVVGDLAVGPDHDLRTVAWLS